MSRAPDDRGELERQLEEAHRQLLERDWEIKVLQGEIAHWRSELDAVLTTRIWRAAERLRAARSRVLGRERN